MSSELTDHRLDRAGAAADNDKVVTARRNIENKVHQSMINTKNDAETKEKFSIMDANSSSRL